MSKITTDESQEWGVFVFKLSCLLPVTGTMHFDYYSSQCNCKQTDDESEFGSQPVFCSQHNMLQTFSPCGQYKHFDDRLPQNSFPPL